MTTAGILMEPGFENRVSVTPESAAQMIKMGMQICVEKNAGTKASHPDNQYEAASAKATSRDEILTNCNLIYSIHPVATTDLDKMKAGTVYISMISPLTNSSYVEELLKRNITCLSLESIPRTTRAQSMDVLSSQATVAGYKAVLMAATTLPKFFPMFMTAAGSIIPSKIMILGAGVAGLQAIATAKRLGGVVEVFDVRAAVKEEVMSLGGKFIEVEGAKDEKSAGGYAVEQTEEFLQKQKQVIHDHASKSDVIICTAQIPGRKAPLLITKETVEAMKPGSVIIDLAASTGGNCEVTQNDKTINHNGVTVIGESNLPSTMPMDASKMFGKNIINLMKIIVDKEGVMNINLEDDILKETVITHQGQISNTRVKAQMQPASV
ncbi:MAG: Re/Si-specific NAD(P)(+) transhydrogenase subunit alpha [Bacteroidetes bacterium]|nr:Re/Si-specific NAD(P)(+) transhydrogenase subunit alpha [Bacteroidota bacterium]